MHLARAIPFLVVQQHCIQRLVTMEPCDSQAAQEVQGPAAAPPQIRSLLSAELAAACALLASVFDDDPWLRWVYRTPEQRRLLIQQNILFYLNIYSSNASEYLSNVSGAWLGDRLISICFFVEPAARANGHQASLFFESMKRACAPLPPSERDAVYQRFLFIESDYFGGPAIDFRGDCYYLFMLGCDAAHRLHGLGSLHVRALMDVAFSGGFGVYLDTFNDDVVDHGAFYGRFGFVLLSRRVLPGQDKFPDSASERAAGEPRPCVVNDTLIAWPSLNSRIQNCRVADAVPVPVSHTDSAAITSIGELRYSVWIAEGPFRAQSGCWTDEYDFLPTCYHWVILGSSLAGDTGLKPSQVVASARLTFHARADDHRDIKIFTDYGERNNRPLRFPVADLGRLVVSTPFRCRGYAQQLNQVRIQAAKDLGCASVVVTASAANAKLLQMLGFVQLTQLDNSPVTVVFDDRPSTVFYALYLAFS
jgi:predicted GNAT family N-acyltransferase